eukprot:203401-Prymnesium_polylepis.1
MRAKPPRAAIARKRQHARAAVPQRRCAAPRGSRRACWTTPSWPTDARQRCRLAARSRRRTGRHQCRRRAWPSVRWRGAPPWKAPRRGIEAKENPERNPSSVWSGNLFRVLFSEMK